MYQKINKICKNEVLVLTKGVGQGEVFEHIMHQKKSYCYIADKQLKLLLFYKRFVVIVMCLPH